MVDFSPTSPGSLRLDEAEPLLVASAAKGSHGAFDILHARYRQRVLRFARARLRDPDEAEDVVQEVFLEAYRSLSSYRGEGSFWSWLAGITHHRICSRARVRHAWMERLDEPEALRAAARRSTWRAETWLDARRALQRCNQFVRSGLPRTQQRMVYLRYAENRSIGSIAGALDRSRGAVKVGLHRSRRKLRRVVGDLWSPGLD